MTGPEHYREAERLVDLIESGEWTDTSTGVAELGGMAQVHATLALVAAIAADRTTLTTAADETKAWPEADGDLSWDEVLK